MIDASGLEPQVLLVSPLRSILLVSSCVAVFLTGLATDLLTQPLVAYFEQAGLPRSASAVSTAIVPVMRFIGTLIAIAAQLSSPAFHKRLRTAVLVLAALGILGFSLPLALPKSVALKAVHAIPLSVLGPAVYALAIGIRLPLTMSF